MQIAVWTWGILCASESSWNGGVQQRCGPGGCAHCVHPAGAQSVGRCGISIRNVRAQRGSQLPPTKRPVSMGLWNSHFPKGVVLFFSSIFHIPVCMCLIRTPFSLADGKFCLQFPFFFSWKVCSQTCVSRQGPRLVSVIPARHIGSLVCTRQREYRIESQPLPPGNPVSSFPRFVYICPANIPR